MGSLVKCENFEVYKFYCRLRFRGLLRFVTTYGQVRFSNYYGLGIATV